MTSPQALASTPPSSVIATRPVPAVRCTPLFRPRNDAARSCASKSSTTTRGTRTEPERLVAPTQNLGRASAGYCAAGRLPEAHIFTRSEFRRSVVNYTIGRTAIGATVGMSALVGLLVGFVVVALSMFSAVLDNLREFGTLKALGTTDEDLTRLLFVQSIAYGLVGSAVGFAIVGRLAEAIRSHGSPC
jgi:predicted lysophospholipase L1 biosynthesis ABC-type transport system permease subunit